MSYSGTRKTCIPQRRAPDVYWIMSGLFQQNSQNCSMAFSVSNPQLDH